MTPGPPLGAEMSAEVSRSLAAGTMSGFGLNTPDCRQAYDELTAQGVDFIQPPSDRPYGVEAIMRDNSGNWMVLVEKKDFTQADFDAPPS